MRTFLIFLAFALVLVGCADEPLQVEEVTTHPEDNIPCTGREPSCLHLDKQISIAIDKTGVPEDKKAKKLKAHSIYGRCEILVNDGKSGDKTYPCSEIRLSLRKWTGEERMTWLQGYDFDIDKLSHGNYKLWIYSDQFDFGNELDKIKPGEALRIQLRLTAKADIK